MLRQSSTLLDPKKQSAMKRKLNSLVGIHDNAGGKKRRFLYYQTSSIPNESFSSINALSSTPSTTTVRSPKFKEIPSFEAKSDANNRIYNVHNLSSLVTENLICRKCKG